MSQSFDSGQPVQLHIGVRQRRPLWMLTLLAIGFGPLLARLFLDEQLARMTTLLVNGLGLADLGSSSIHLVRLGVRFLLPTCAALALLRFTSLGEWFALTPLSLACLLVGDTLLILNLVDQLRLYVLSGYPAFHFTGDLAAAVATVALCSAAVSLALATSWYRSERARQWLGKTGVRWWREA